MEYEAFKDVRPIEDITNCLLKIGIVRLPAVTIHGWDLSSLQNLTK